MTYTCCVKAVGESSVGEDVCNSFQTLEAAPTGAPQNVRGHALSSLSLSLTWEQPLPEVTNGQVREYRVQITAVRTGITRSYIVTEPRLGVTSLHPYYQYMCSVAAVTTDLGPYSSLISIQTYEDVPSGPPLNLTATSSTSTSLSLSWDLPLTEHRNGLITGYSITATVTSSGLQQQHTTSSHRAFTITSLMINTRYTVSVAASTVNGTGPFTVGYDVTTLDAPPTRSPRLFGGVAESPSTLRLIWSPPNHQPSNSVIREYQVNITEVETEMLRTLDTPTTSITVSSLHPFYNYQCTVAAYTNSVGPFTAPIFIQMPTDAPSGPPTSVRVTLTLAPTPSAIVTWNPPIPEHQNGIITSYIVALQNMETGLSSQSSTSLEMFSLASLIWDSLYTIKVTALTSAGRGPYSEVISLPIGTGVPSAPPGAFQISGPVLSTSLSFVWAPPPIDQQNGVITGYSLFLIESETGREISFNVVTGTAYTAINLHPYYTYFCHIAAYTNEGMGPFTANITQTTAEGVPSGAPRFISNVTVTPRELALTWSELQPSETNGIIVGYVLCVTQAVTGESFKLYTQSTQHTVPTLPYTTYLFVVAANTSVGRGPLSVELTLKTTEDIPSDHPQNISYSVRGPTSFLLSWQSPPEQYHHGDIRSYRVNVTERLTGRMLHFTSETTQLVVMDLHPYYLYDCSVAAVTVGVGPHSATLTVRTAEDAPSSPPTDVTATAVDSRTIRIEWGVPSTEEQNGIIRKYQVTISSPYGADPINLFTTTMMVVIGDLIPYSLYSCRVAAFTTPENRSPLSDPVTITTPSAVPSGPPQNVRVIKESSRALTITWEPPLVTQRNGEILLYQVLLFDMVSDSRRVKEVDGDSFRVGWTNLHPFYTYTFSVAAATSLGLGPHSHNDMVLLAEAAPSSAPVNVTVDVLSQTTATVSWDPPNLSDHNGLIRQYRIVLMEVGGTGAVKNFTTVGQTGLYVFDFLRPGQVYLVKIAAETIDIGPSSEYVEFSSRDDVPGLSTNFEVAIADSTSTHLTWSPPSRDQQNGVILGYVINVMLITPRRTNSQQLTFETTSLNYTITSLHPSWTYLFSVAANTSAGLGASVFHVGTLHEDAPSEPPQNLAGTNHTSKTMYLFWDPPPVDEQNGVVRNYKITVLNQETGVSIMYSTTGTRYIFEDLHPYYQYTYSVAAHTVKTGPYASVVIRQPEDIPTGSPTDASVYHTSPTNAIVQWSSVSAHLQNGLISGYTVRATPLDSDIEYENVVGPNVFMYEFHRVSSNTPYTFSVAAMTSVGRGPFITVSSTTPEGVPSVAPNIGSVTRISATQIQLQWAPLSVEDIQGTLTSYLVRYRVVESRVRRNIDDSAVVVEVSGTDKIIDGLEPHLTYGVSVAARTARGIGNYSEEMIVGLFENSPFQLHMFGAIVCLPWTEAGTAEKMISIIEELSLNVQDMCTCDFSSKYIAQREVLCGNLSTDRVIFHGTFISTANNTGTQFRDHLQQWVYSEPTIIVQGVQLTVVPCSVNVEESCVPAPEISTPTSVTTISATTIADVVGISLPLIGGVAGGGVLLICGVFTLILIMVCLKTKLKTKEHYNVRRHLNALTLQTSSPFASSSNRAPSKTNEVELQDSKIYKDEHVYEDPSNFEFFSSHQIQPPPLPPNLNNTASSQINFNTLKHETDIDKTYSEVDVPTHETFNTFCRDVHTNRKPVGEKEAYSQLDVNAMPRLHYGNIGASAIIPNDYHYPTISGPFKSENATYSEPLPDPLPSSADQHAASSKDKCAERSQQSNYEPLLPPPRGTKARDIPCTEYQSLGPPVGYAVPSSLRNTSELKIDDAQTRNGPLQGNSDVPQPGLGDDIQMPDNYVDMSSPSLQ